MIAAVLAPSVADRDERMARIVAWAGPTSARWTVGRAVFATWPHCGRAGRTGDGAVLGRLDTAVDHLGLDLGRASGDFALVSPAADDGLLLARAQLAGRPLYYWRDRATGAVVVCSQLAGLLHVIGHRPSLNVQRLASLAVEWPHFDPTATVYDAVSRVDLGQALVLSLERRVATRTHAIGVEPLLEGTAEELADQLRAHVLSAVRRSIEGATRVAVMAGGGVDSSGLLAAAVAIARGAPKRDVQAIAFDFAGPGDDRPYLRALASALGLEPIRVGASGLSPFLRKTLVIDASPAAWPSIAVDVGLAAAAREAGADRLISGVCGDDLIDGEPRFLAQVARGGHLVEALRDAVRLRLYWRTSAAERVVSFVLRPLAATTLPWLALATRRMRNRVDQDWLGPELRALVETTAARDRRRYPQDVHLRSRHRILAARYLQSVMEVQAQVTAATGLATASPFLDRELVSFVTRIPPTMLLHGGRLKGLYRLAMRGLVPDQILDRPDKAEFVCGYDEVVQGAGGFGALEDLATMRELGRLGLVEPAPYLRAYRKLTGEARASGEWLLLWPALAVEAFVRAYERGDLTPRPPRTVAADVRA